MGQELNERAVLIARQCAKAKVPYKHMGHGLTQGMDCLGLTVYIATELGFSINWEPYGMSAQGYELQRAIEKQPFLREVELLAGDELVPGDVLLMRFARHPHHVAIYAGQTIIHSYIRVGRVTEHRFADVWKAKVFRAYRWSK